MNSFLTTKIPALLFITDALPDSHRTVYLQCSAPLALNYLCHPFIAVLATKGSPSLRRNPWLSLQTPQGLLAKSTITRLSLAALVLALSKRQRQCSVLKLPKPRALCL
jgi:hypothetical protein